MDKSNSFCWKKFRKAFFFWKCAKYKFEFLHNQTIFVKNIFFSERVIIILCQKKKIFFFTHSHWQAVALQSLFIRQGVENSNLWGLLFTLSSSHFQQKKILFCWQWELDSVNNRPHKLEFSTPLSYEQALEGHRLSMWVCEKKIFFFWQSIMMTLSEKKMFLTKMVWLWRNSNLYFAHFQKKMPFEISSSKNSYFWTRTVANPFSQIVKDSIEIWTLLRVWIIISLFLILIV